MTDKGSESMAKSNLPKEVKRRSILAVANWTLRYAMGMSRDEFTVMLKMKHLLWNRSIVVHILSIFTISTIWSAIYNFSSEVGVAHYC